MKKMMFVIAAAAVLVLMVGLFSGNSVALADEAAVARWSLAKKSAGFIGGWVSGFLFHEAGHEVVARVEGVGMSWQGADNRWLANTYDQGKLRNIALGGFGAQIISTEIILGIEKIPKDNAFVFGWLGFNIINSLLYVLDNELRDGIGDLETLRATGVNTGFVEIGLVAHSILTAYRIYKNPKFIPYVRATRGELALGIGWRF